MTGRVTAARQMLVDALEQVWPGRVHPYEPARPSPTAGIYVGTVAGGHGGADGTTWVGTFSVRLVADGANHAAHALLDELLDACFDAFAATEPGAAGLYPDAFSFEPFDADETTALPAYTFTVGVQLVDTSSWCAPAAPAAVQFPPVPIGA